MATRSRDSLSTPDIPAGTAVVTIYSSTRISAPASLVFRTLRNTDTWRDWNRFIPRVNMTYQPPEMDDLVTAAEIRELVKNTSLAGSVDSDITDGAASGTGSLTGRRLSLEEKEEIRRSPPPVTTERLRSVASISSSTDTGPSAPSSPKQQKQQQQQQRRHTTVGLPDRPKSSASRHSNGGTEGSHHTNNSGPPQARRGSYAAPLIEAEEKATSNNSNNDNSNGNSNGNSNSNSRPQSRRSSFTPANAMERERLALLSLYGEPSVRIQLGTKMTLYCRMSLPKSWSTDRDIQVVVTEVSRPNDEAAATGDGNNNGDDEDRLRKATTHTQNKTGVYRLVWTLRSSYSSLASSSPKFLSQAQRVHEIRPVISGDGKEECVYDDWECHRGMLAKNVRTKYQDYLNKRFDEWGNGLKAYCEALGGAVERRDFVNSK